MKTDDIEVHIGTPDFHFRHIRRLEARVEAATNFARTPTMEEANDKLRQMAAKVGANAIIDVSYKNGASMTSWRGITASGNAVVRESEDYPCPVCAEPVKRAAIRCRHCGADLVASPVELPAAHVPPVYEEPMRESNNSIVPYVIGTIVVIVMLVVVIAGNS